MKYILIFILFLSSFVFATPDDSQVLHIYLCSRLTEAAKKWNDEISKELGKGFYLFRPQDVDLNAFSQDERDLAAYKADFEGMNQSHLLLVLPPYGRDCAWEIGWFNGQEKPAIAYTEFTGDWLKDAMVKGGLTAIVTNNLELYHLLLNDPSISKKSYWISSRESLPLIIKEIYDQSLKK